MYQKIVVVIFLLSWTFISVSTAFAQDDTGETLPQPTIIVNSSLDDPRGCPDRCTLRNAIATAKSGDVIGFSEDIIGPIVLVQPLIIDKDLSIIGAGMDLLVIDGGGIGPIFQIEGDVTVLLADMTIQNGRIINEFGTASGQGGGIFNNGDNNLTLLRIRITDNIAGQGGGIYNRGSLEIIDSEITNNRTETDEFLKKYGYIDGSGGAIYNVHSDLIIRNSIISDNRAGYGGGGYFVTGTAQIIHSTFSNNSAERGGGGAIAYDTGLRATEFDIHGSEFTNNSSQGDAGAISIGEGGIYNSIFTENRAEDGYGGAILAGGIAIQNTTISSNYSSECGGGVDSEGAMSQVTIANSTIQDNRAVRCGGGISSWETAVIVDSLIQNNSSGQGGGMYFAYYSYYILNSTITNNRSNSDGGGLYFDGVVPLVMSTTVYQNTAKANGGGIFATSSFQVGNTIIAKNEAQKDGQDIFGEATSLGNNLVTTPSENSWFASDQIGVDPLLLPLEDYGGDTLTLALAPNSPAIDTGYCVFEIPDFPLMKVWAKADQRGRERDDLCDIGAFEYSDMDRDNPNITSERIPTSTPSPTPSPSPTVESGTIQIVEVVGIGDLKTEGVVIRNNNRRLELTGWTISDSNNNVYTFEEYFLQGYTTITVYTRPGDDTVLSSYWGLSHAVFDEHDIVELRDSTGVLQSVFHIDGQGAVSEATATQSH